MAAPRRNRRARRAGNPAELMPPLWRIAARDTNRVPDGRSKVDAFREGFPNWVQCMPYGQIVTAHGQDRPGASRPTCRHPASGLCSCGAVEYQRRPCRSAVTNSSRRTKFTEPALPDAPHLPESKGPMESVLRPPTVHSLSDRLRLVGWSCVGQGGPGRAQPMRRVMSWPQTVLPDIQ